MRAYSRGALPFANPRQVAPWAKRPRAGKEGAIQAASSAPPAPPAEPAAEEATEWFELAAQANAKLIDEGYVSRSMYDEMMQHLSDYRAAAGSD